MYGSEGSFVFSFFLLYVKTRFASLLVQQSTNCNEITRRGYRVRRDRVLRNFIFILLDNSLLTDVPLILDFLLLFSGIEYIWMIS